MNRLDHIQRAQAELGQAIERMGRAFDAVEDIEPYLAARLKAMIGRAREAEEWLSALEDKEPVRDPDPYLTHMEEA